VAVHKKSCSGEVKIQGIKLHASGPNGYAFGLYADRNATTKGTCWEVAGMAGVLFRTFLSMPIPKVA